MFKVISAELKKMVSKPGIYVLAILLAIILVLGVFIYNPTVYSTSNITLTGSTVMEKYTYFIGEGSGSIKLQADTSITDASNKILSYTIDGKTQEENIEDLYDTFVMYYNNYREAAYNDTPANVITTYRNNLINALNSLNTAITTGVNNSSAGAYTILTTRSNYDRYTSAYESVRTLFSTNTSNIADICQEYEDSYRNDFTSSIDALIYPTLSEELIRDYTVNEEGTKLHTELSRLNDINDSIQSIYNEVRDGTKDNESISVMQELEDLANLYMNTASTFTNLVNYELLSNAFSFVNTNDQLDLLYLENETQYNSNTLLIRYDYLFDNNKTENDYAHPLTIGVTSNDEINAYDYAYFILRLFSFIIIVYAIMSACHAIAGEIKEGSMRYFAIRPVNRLTLYFGKFLAIILMSLIMIIFSAIIAVCVGGAVYGFSSASILTIFNSTTAIVIHPIVMLIIYLVSLLLELIVYTSIAMLLSCLFKSDLFAVTLMIVLYLLNTLLPVFVTGANSWLTYYPFSHISLYSLFGSSIYAISNNFLNMLLGAKVYAGTNIGLTITVIVLFVVIINLLATVAFKKKEL